MKETPFMYKKRQNRRESDMSTELAKEKNYSISFSGTCKHCGNATLMYILELDVQTCAYCHHVTSNSDRVSNLRIKDKKPYCKDASATNNN